MPLECRDGVTLWKDEIRTQNVWKLEIDYCSDMCMHQTFKVGVHSRYQASCISTLEVGD